MPLFYHKTVNYVPSHSVNYDTTLYTAVARGRSQNAPTVWRVESVHGFASVGKLYQKMHFAGSNLSKAPKRCASRARRGNASTKFRKTSESKKESSKANGPDLRTVACAKAQPNLALNLHKPIRCPRGIGAVLHRWEKPSQQKRVR